MTDIAKTLVCSVCQRPRIVEWSGKWTPAERLFLTALLARIQREEKTNGKQRGDEWQNASPDHDWMSIIANASGEYITEYIANLIVKTVLEFCPDIDLDKWLKGIQERICQ